MSLAMLPRPSLTLTVPSLHDGLPIDCRVYHPPALAASPDAPPNAPPNAPSWQKHAAIIAHPYAPLGGCYDDPIVDIVAGTLLRLGFLVGTFNFRGAQGSAGRTSWTAKAERGDYMAVVGFVSHYVHFLDPFSPAGAGADHALEGGDAAGDAAGDVPSAIRIRPPTPDYVPATTPILLLGGYSYGAMITSQLPSFEAIVALFISPECGSPAAEVRLRAQHLAEMQNTVLASARNAAIDRPTPTTPRRHVGLRNTTLAIYGDRDGFVPVRKLRAWASRLQAVPDSRFRAHEVSGADHFWASGNVAFTLREAVRAFGASLLDHNDIDDTLK
ncbi:00857250-0bb6-4047-9dc5-33d554d64b8d [Thermothielavioides terrestris]|uniref:00857250-0bb6-4047-9dc5-33d554d64b8d n=1 Tax=Thermothielavioides terrestris TaxID=2587410 RepID=A0A446BV00_9PEZI|nr:00857250-0bb6-4047-9dc5-33d554d64b8d [Thermothielavioides terrestris]